ncbi:hypothetical protein KBC04_03265 [Candidatus Babeliales bacterium]|nr:hypothetical protein [Candidatus Babeliales bacterium]MBP9843929.1 hypothetical protein [Candidatus Babeliales bacterium]
MKYIKTVIQFMLILNFSIENIKAIPTFSDIFASTKLRDKDCVEGVELREIGKKYETETLTETHIENNFIEIRCKEIVDFEFVGLLALKLAVNNSLDLRNRLKASVSTRDIHFSQNAIKRQRTLIERSVLKNNENESWALKILRDYSYYKKIDIQKLDSKINKKTELYLQKRKSMQNDNKFISQL